MNKNINPEEWTNRLVRRGEKAFDAIYSEFNEILSLRETNREEWDAIEKRMGHCYELTHKFVKEHPEFLYVRGVINNIFKPSSYTYLHAWAEKDDIAFDPVLGRQYKKEQFYLIFNPKKVKTYTYEEVLSNFMYYGNYLGWKEKSEVPVKYNPSILTEEALKCFFHGDRMLADKAIREGFIHPKTIGKMLRRKHKVESVNGRNEETGFGR